MTTKKSLASATMDQFFTRQNAEKGIKVPLLLPDGTPTAEFVVIRGVDSDIFRTRETQTMRKTAEALAELEAEAKEKKRKVDPDTKSKVMDEIELELISVLVKDWSFPMECTLENVMDFLREAPQVRNLINTKAGARKDFFELNAKPSANGQNENSNSNDAQKDQK
ncbi:hypothetical protein [Vibrio phage VpKK5]|uniref:hypothetical protein n=1 Tax=Vibrio phage VpKK5 TaxID=1538804 RepID=UPI0004F614F0|nr:hypothetical protein VC55_gp48 [Vibrio phage VpKK5]AIM40550.1 hypothetical protein [Vibrio phage VpKK5]